MILSSIKDPLDIRGDTLGLPVLLKLPETGCPLGLRLRCGSREEILCGPGADRLLRWVPPLALAEEYPDRVQIPVTLILEGYRGAAPAETRETEILLKVPENIVPTVSLTVKAESGTFTQGGTALAEVTAEGSLGAEIRHCRIRCGALSGFGRRLRFDLPQAGEIPVMATVTDSRGRQAEAGTVIHVAAAETGSDGPLLDLCPENRSLGIGCRGETASALTMGMDVRMGGCRLTELPDPGGSTEALSLGAAEARFLGLQKLWENPQPGQAFPAQVLPVSGTLLLIEAADTAGGTGRVWEIIGSGGSIRVPSGGSLVSRSVLQTEAGLSIGAAGDNSRAVPLNIYRLKGDA